MHMPRHTHPRREACLDETVGTSGVFARQTYGTDGNVEIPAVDSRLMFDGGGSVNERLVVWHEYSLLTG
jgi:hypothetical protein